MNTHDVYLIRELSVIDAASQLHNHPVLSELDDNGFFSNQRFTFVGVYNSAITDTTIIGYPKYLPEHIEDREIPSVISHVNLICQVVEQAQPYLDRSLFDSSYSFNAYNTQVQMQYINRYNLATTILQDYMTHGIYYCKTKQTVRNGSGEIQWHYTIQNSIPIIDKDVVYLDTFHYTTRQDYSQLITHLHTWIVSQCARLLQGIGQYQELDLPEVTVSFDDADLSQFTPYLLGKLNSVFSDREVRLIKSLSAWCGQSLFYHNQMGVTTFDKIWEYATKKVFGNIEHTRSGPPSYVVDGEEYKAHGDSIPDILRVFKYSAEGCNVIGILDAKYYCPEVDLGGHSIYGVPANADITKQVGYYRYMKQLYPLTDMKFTNAFLFPSRTNAQEGLFENFGYAYPNRERYTEIDELLSIVGSTPHDQHDRVLLYGVNPTLLFKACLNGFKVDDASFYNGFILPFEED